MQSLNKLPAFFTPASQSKIKSTKAVGIWRSLAGDQAPGPSGGAEEEDSDDHSVSLGRPPVPCQRAKHGGVDHHLPSYLVAKLNCLSLTHSKHPKSTAQYQRQIP